jgi:hypothetical protein
MNRNFEYDFSGSVAVELALDTGKYIKDRIQEFHGTRYGMLIDESAQLVFPYDDTPISEFQRKAFTAGASVVLDALSYSDLTKFQIDYMKRTFLNSGLTEESKRYEPEIIYDVIEAAALIGMSSHPELQDKYDTISRYYVETSPNINLQTPVFLGVGRTAFVLDSCFKSLLVNNPKFDIAHTLGTIDWSSLEPEDIIGDQN